MAAPDLLKTEGAEVHHEGKMNASRGAEQEEREGDKVNSDAAPSYFVNC